MVLQELIKDVSREKTTLSKIANAMAHLLVRPLPALRKQTDLSDDRLSVVSAGAHGPDLPGRRSADRGERDALSADFGGASTRLAARAERGYVRLPSLAAG